MKKFFRSLFSKIFDFNAKKVRRIPENKLPYGYKIFAMGQDTSIVIIEPSGGWYTLDYNEYTSFVIAKRPGQARKKIVAGIGLLKFKGHV